MEIKNWCAMLPSPETGAVEDMHPRKKINFALALPMPKRGYFIRKTSQSAWRRDQIPNLYSTNKAPINPSTNRKGPCSDTYLTIRRCRTHTGRCTVPSTTYTLTLKNKHRPFSSHNLGNPDTKDAISIHNWQAVEKGLEVS